MPCSLSLMLPSLMLRNHPPPLSHPHSVSDGCEFREAAAHEKETSYAPLAAVLRPFYRHSTMRCSCFSYIPPLQPLFRAPLIFPPFALIPSQRYLPFPVSWIIAFLG